MPKKGWETLTYVGVHEQPGYLLPSQNYKVCAVASSRGTAYVRRARKVKLVHFRYKTELHNDVGHVCMCGVCMCVFVCV